MDTPYDWDSPYGPQELRDAQEHDEAADDYYGAGEPGDELLPLDSDDDA